MNARLAVIAPVLVAVVSVCAPARAEELLFANPQYTTQYGAASSVKAGAVTDTEIADDFDANGLITRVYVESNTCKACFAPSLLGAHIRFYAWTAHGPGALLSHEFLPITNPKFHVGEYGTLDLRLEQPFAASGKAFFGMQLEFVQNVPPFDAWYWSYDWSNLALGSPQVWGVTAHQRGVLSSSAFSPGVDWAGTSVTAQMRFSIYGSTGGLPDLGNDLCGVWAGIPTPDPAGSHHAILRDVDMMNDADIWSVGEAYVSATGETVPIAMHFDGAQWTTVPTPVPAAIPGDANCGLDAVKMIAPDDVWAGGWQYKQDAAGYVGPHLFVIHWNGSSWTLMNTPMPPTLGLQGGSGEYVFDIDAIAPDDVWFVGAWIEPLKSQRPALAMHRDGSNFTVLPVPLVNTKGDRLNAVTMIASDDVWATGGYLAAGGTQHPYHIHWDGSSWSLVSLAEPGILNQMRALTALSPTDIWACGETFVNTKFEPWFVHYDGSNWSQVASPGGGSGLYARSSTEIYSVGSEVVYWDGSSWSTIVTKFGDALGVSLGAVTGDGGCGIFAVGRENVAGDLLTYCARVLPNLWGNLGGGVGGSTGTPFLVGEGAAFAGQLVIVSLTQAPPSVPIVLMLGTQTAPQPFLGGLLYPVPQIVVAGLPTDANGKLMLWTTWPAAVPAGIELYLQTWMPDATAPFGVAGSNALYMLTP